MPVELPFDLTLEEKKQFLRELKEARFSGASRIKFKERDVTFRSDLELRALIDDLKGEIVEDTGPVKPRKRVGLTTFRKGY